MTCSVTDSTGPCEKDAEYRKAGMCRMHYQRLYSQNRMGVGKNARNGKQPCPMTGCEGYLFLTPQLRPMSFGKDIIRKRICDRCHREQLTIETVIPRRTLGALVRTRRRDFFALMLSETDTPADDEAGVDVASTSQTTSDSTGSSA